MASLRVLARRPLFRLVLALSGGIVALAGCGPPGPDAVAVTFAPESPAVSDPGGDVGAAPIEHFDLRAPDRHEPRPAALVPLPTLRR
jgi:hypothetical protein